MKTALLTGLLLSLGSFARADWSCKVTMQEGGTTKQIGKTEYVRDEQNSYVVITTDLGMRFIAKRSGPGNITVFMANTQDAANWIGATGTDKVKLIHNHANRTLDCNLEQNYP